MNARYILLVLALVSSPAFAGYVTGAKLNTWAEASDRMASGNPRGDDYADATRLHAYLWGVLDAYEGILICTNETATTGQVKAIVAQYVKAHPERWGESAHGLVFTALQAVFPCKK